MKEKLIGAMVKPINIDEEASENNIEDPNTIETIKCYLQLLNGVTSLKLFCGCQIGNLLEKCFLQRKGHIQRCFNGMQNQNKMG